MTKFLGYFNRFWLTGFFFLFIAFFSVKKEQDFMVIVRYAMIGMSILTIFGVINYIQKRSDFVTGMLSNHTNLVSFMQEGGNLYTNASRFRVQSMFQNPFDYGYICSCFLMMCIYCKDKLKKKHFWIMVICCVFGILTCNCRTVIICLLLGISAFVLFAYRIGKITFSILCALMILPLVYIFIPEFANRVDTVLTVFTDDQDSGGSSITMRTIQFLTTLRYIEDNPLFGNGVGFFDIDLGWGESNNEVRVKLLDYDLWGLEGVYLRKLMEHGWVGYILYTTVWAILLFYLLHHRNTHRKIVALGISIWIIYFAFAYMTGELKSVPPTVIVLGCIIGVTSTDART